MKAAHTTIQRISAAIALISNFVLILLIKCKSHRKVGKYKYLMIYISFFEILYAILDALTVPDIYSKDSAFLVVIQAEQALVPSSVILYADVLFCVFFGISMAIFAVHFIYRYLVVTQNSYTKMHETRIIVGLIVFTMIFGVFWYWVAYFFLSPFEEADQFLYENFLEKHSINVSEVTYIGPLFWPKGENGDEYLYMRSFLGIVIMTTAIFISFFAIVLFGVKCYQQTKALVAQTSKSASFAAVQTQLFYALVFQTLIPVVLMHIPASIGFIASFFNISCEPLGIIPSLTICLYPTLDPLPNFFIIKSYRDAIKNFFSTIKRKVLCRGNRVGEEVARSEAVSNLSRTSANA